MLCVNKMDLVGWSQERFEEIKEEFRQFAIKLDVHDLTFIPVSALLGDNIVARTENMSWYDGPSLLHHLEQVHIASDRNLIDARFPVQYVIRPQKQTDADLHDFRGYAGTVASGVFKPGDEIVALPSGFTSTVKAVHGPGGDVIDEAFAPSAVCIELTDDLDVSRGDQLCRLNNRPQVGQEIDAMVCWLTEQTTLSENNRYSLLHTTRSTKAQIVKLDYRLDVNSLHRDEKAESLSLNEIGRISIKTQQPLMFDPYRRNRVTGSFILVDETTGNTVAAGMINGPTLKESRVVWHSSEVSREERATAGATVWLTGLSASGKSTIAVELERRLVAAGIPAYRLDGDNLRHGLNADLGFSADDRAENVRRVGSVAQLFADSGAVAVACLISPYREDRDRVRAAHEAAGLKFVEVYVDTPIEQCEARDPKGMYAKARAGEITGFTGVDDPYEAPKSPELVIRPEDGTPTELALRIMEVLDR